MRRLCRVRTTAVALLAMTGFGFAVMGQMYRMGASIGTVGVSTAAAPAAAEASRERGPQYTMPFATITSGGVVFDNGSFAIIGQPIIGTISNAGYSMQVGAVALLAHLTASVPGDCDGDGDVDLDDFAGIEACLLGPGGGLGAGCDCYDADDDGDVDVADFALFQVAFTGTS